jgi:hypothetical protein
VTDPTKLPTPAAERPAPAPAIAAPVKKARPIPGKIKTALEAMLVGKARNLTQAAKAAGISREYLSRTLSARPDIVVWAQNRAARVLGIGASVAAAKMLDLIHSNSSRVQFESSRHVLALAGIKPASDASVSVNVGIELKAGYVIDLSERDEPAARIVGGAVIDAKPVDAKAD